MAKATEAHGYELVLPRTFAAGPDAVFRAWTDCDIVARWLCHDADRNKVRVRKFDFRVTGSFRLEVTRPEDVRLVFGTYEELAPPERLTFDWAWERTLPDPGVVTSGGPTRVTVLLLERNGTTELRLTQGPFPSEQRRDEDRAGWDASFVALDGVLADPALPARVVER